MIGLLLKSLGLGLGLCFVGFLLEGESEYSSLLVNTGAVLLCLFCSVYLLGFLASIFVNITDVAEKIIPDSPVFTTTIALLVALLVGVMLYALRDVSEPANPPIYRGQPLGD